MNCGGRTALVLTLLAVSALACAGEASDSDTARSLRRAIRDLAETFGPRYPNGGKYLQRLNALVKAGGKGQEPTLRQLQRQALLDNPLLDGLRVLLVKRKPRGRRADRFGFPSNHECNASLRRTGWDNEIAALSPAESDGQLTTLYRPSHGGWVGEMDLAWDARRLLFAQGNRTNWAIHELSLPSAEGDAKPSVRQVSRMPDDVDAFDPCLLPDGRIVFGSTASYQSVPCWHGARRAANLYLMNADGSGVRQLCFDQDHDFHPVVRSDGQVLFHRWDYTGINHIFLRQLMAMNPDGTGQRAVYGSNSWFPNALYFPREIPGQPGRIVCILSGYHGTHRAGWLVLLDLRRGAYDDDGIVARISGRGQPVEVRIRDRLVDGDWPKFLHPWPLSDPDTGAGAGRYFLVACKPSPKHTWGIYLADAFDNLVLLREEQGCGLFEPVPLRPRRRPPVIADKMQPSEDHGVVYLHNVYAGPGLEGVPRGTVKRLRVVAYHFGYRGLAGPDKIGRGGPWEAMRIVGTVPLDQDGSAVFRAPANTPLAVQPLDAEGKAVQLMRSWFTLMPGESLSCVGCHEPLRDAVPRETAAAAKHAPADITPWHGPPRGFDFQREVQPVLDAHCVPCHDGQEAGPDLRGEDAHPDYRGKPLSTLGKRRLHPKLKKQANGRVKYTPAYDALLPYVRRVSIEDDVSLLLPGEYHADTSELVQMLEKGHGGVQLDDEAWDRLVTWIDLNAPCHGTWHDVFPVPENADQRRAELRAKYGGPPHDPEHIPDTTGYKPPKAQSANGEPRPPVPSAPAVPHWPFSAAEARRRQAALGERQRTIDLGDGISLTLLRIPAGEFLMGSADGPPDERPPTRVRIAKPFWLGRCEVTNAQFRRFDPAFSPRYYQRLHARGDDRGLPLDAPDQPAVRVSWTQAMAFSRWLSERTGTSFTLPTEAQWEWACRAGTATPLHYGGTDADFSAWANAADRAYADVKNNTGGLEHLIVHGQALCDGRFADGARVTAPVGRYRPNAWGLHDMHGNAAEWTRTAYRPYPYRESDGRNAAGSAVSESASSPITRHASRVTYRVVRGGSFFDRPERTRSAFRLAYPAWQRVFNVGFRVACEE
jgi:formylglycine-generating enzyme required for sulfatase activity